MDSNRQETPAGSQAQRGQRKPQELLLQVSLSKLKCLGPVCFVCFAWEVRMIVLILWSQLGSWGKMCEAHRAMVGFST